MMANARRPWMSALNVELLEAGLDTLKLCFIEHLPFSQSLALGHTTLLNLKRSAEVC
jgi:hypothetical protein